MSNQLHDSSDSSDRPSDDSPDRSSRAYWSANLRLLAGLLAVWAFVSFGFGIIFADALNAYKLPGTGFPLGFWIAQQGSIYLFCGLVFVYAWRMNVLDRRFGVAESDPQ